MTKCDKCQSSAIIYQKYSGMRLCQSHFDEDVHRKIRESLRQTGLFGRGAHVALALDGGKDSASMAFVLKGIFRNRRDIDFVAIIIDEEGAPAKPARLIAEQLEIPYVEKRLPTSPLPAIVPQDACSGFDTTTQRMEHLISLAQEMEASVLATGHNLDDEATDVFISYLWGDVDGLLAHSQGIREEGKIPWIKPLRRIPEKEVRLFAIKHGLAYSDVARRDPFRTEAKRLLCNFDSLHPGTKYSLLRGQEKLSRHRRGGSTGQSL
jgi:tRNA(Ile)-lysidine synthase TilS/MesJ